MRPDLRGYFDAEVADIRRRFGEFILINTNFGYVNAFASRLNLMQESMIPGGAWTSPGIVDTSEARIEPTGGVP